MHFNLSTNRYIFAEGTKRVLTTRPYKNNFNLGTVKKKDFYSFPPFYLLVFNFFKSFPFVGFEKKPLNGQPGRNP